ncbi:hypothetical protein [Kingella negevensis]|uniref:Uncharacterized protein n=1 Tax=Kingella negevensis TaxID=1522312 RepID=A0A238TCY3_9NEIS|nr:hypothetical protein [Kingella negevensis]MDK4690341.1 hypothetical protein [Kingella negevensis]MDK4692311.1 hypothetical protein [Kingella negevensis]SNB64172.1 Uncharacterised protein [Kingella negevensis]
MKNKFALINDLYVERDNQGNLVSYIKCDHSPRVQQCELRFGMEPELRILLVVLFQKFQLKNRKGIKESTKTIMRGLINNQIK